MRSDRKALVHLLTHLMLVVLLAIVSYRSFKVLPLYFSIPIYFVFTNVFFIFMGLCSGIHEMSHGTVFKTKSLNWFFMRFISFITWSDYVFYRESHMKHHQYTAHHGLEQEVVLPLKLRIRDFIYSLIGIILTKEWLLLLLITFPMASSSIASYAVTMSQHSGLQADVADSRKCCRSVKLGPIYQFLYWNMNYHIEHHMYASVPFYNLKKLSEAIEGDMPERKTLFEAYNEIIQIQKRQKIEPEYYYVAQCPD